MSKNRVIILILLLCILFTSNIAHGISDKKTIIIVLDELDLDLINELDEDNYSMGLLNSRNRGSYDETSFFMTIALGRKVKIKEEQYEGLEKKDGDSIHVVGFDAIKSDLLTMFPKYNKKVQNLGERLKNEGVSYIGEGESSLIACDDDGNIDSGETKVLYDEEWLKSKTDDHLNKSNVLVLSYDIEEKSERIQILKSYLEHIGKHNIMIFPKKVSSSMKKGTNNSLVPILYKTSVMKPGILTSDSTRRKGIITSLDISSQVLNIYNIKDETCIGKNFLTYSSQNPREDLSTIFKEVINMTWITYIFHGIVYLIQLYFTYYFLKDRRDKYWDITFYFNFIIITIFISLIMGLFDLQRNFIIYMVTCIMLSYSLSYFITQKKLNGVVFFSFLTYLTMVLGIFFRPDFLYNSYIGYDNLIIGSRFYGFNNGAMAVLLATSIISYFSIKDTFSNEVLEKFLVLVFFTINIIALSAKFGANTGGFFTSIVLFLVMLYMVFFKKEFTIKNVIILILIGGLILFLNLFLDLYSVDKSHAGSLIYRAKILGNKEVYGIVKVKIKELLLYTLSPPWSLVIISQILCIKSFWEKTKSRFPYLLDIRPEIHKEYIIFLITAITGLLVNDTGSIAFIYMIQYLLVLFINVSIAKEV